MADPPIRLRIAVVAGGPEADRLVSKLHSLEPVETARAVTSFGTAEQLLRGGFNVLLLDVFVTGAVQAGLEFLQTVQGRFPRVSYGLFSQPDLLEKMPGVGPSWRQRFQSYLRIPKTLDESALSTEAARAVQWLVGDQASQAAAPGSGPLDPAEISRLAADMRAVAHAYSLFRAIAEGNGDVAELRRATGLEDAQVERALRWGREAGLLIRLPSSSGSDPYVLTSRGREVLEVARTIFGDTSDQVADDSGAQSGAATNAPGPVDAVPNRPVENPSSDPDGDAGELGFLMDTPRSAAATAKAKKTSTPRTKKAAAPAAEDEPPVSQGAVPQAKSKRSRTKTSDAATLSGGLSVPGLPGGRLSQAAPDDFSTPEHGAARQTSGEEPAEVVQQQTSATGQTGVAGAWEPSGEPPLSDASRWVVRYGVALCNWAPPDGTPKLPASVALLAAFMALARSDAEPQYVNTAAFLANFLAAGKLGVEPDAVQLLRLDRFGLTALPDGPSGDYPAQLADAAAQEELLAVLRKAGGYARAVHVAQKDGPELRTGMRHLFAALVTDQEPRLPSAEHLAGLGFSLQTLRSQFFRTLRGPELEESESAWRAILLPAAPPRPDFHDEAPAASVEGDSPFGRDRLDVTPEVNALAAVLASKQLKPPLSVGLFGDWGTGKSFFMGQMQKRIRKLRQDARDGKPGADAFCSSIVQIRFNAWHYMDANLWASLVTGVFDGLAKALRREKESPAAVRERLLKRLAEEHMVLQEAERRRIAAEAATTRARDRVEQVRNEKNGLRALLGAGDDVLRRALAQREVTGELASLARSYGVPESVVLERAWTGQLQSGWGKAKAAWEVVTGRGGDRRRLALTAFFFVLIAAVAFGAWRLAAWASTSTEVRALATLAGAALVAVTQFLAQFRPVLDRLKKLAPRARELVQDAQALADTTTAAVDRPEVEARKAVAQLEAEETAAREAHGQAVRQVQQVKEEIEEISAGRRLHRFIAERSATADYRRHLGIVALIRDDFQRLSRLLREAGTSADGGVPQVERIILYIDDLDRCPETRVVEVLQAVHLLLAFPLFVVVVGVDSRWLLRSVQSHYSELIAQGDGAGGEPRRAGGDDDEDDDHWTSTPQNYLEKIFQIPFTLRPMDPTGYASLIQGLIPVPEDGPALAEHEDEEELEDESLGFESPPAPAPGEAEAPAGEAAAAPVTAAGSAAAVPEAAADAAPAGGAGSPAPPDAAVAQPAAPVDDDAAQPPAPPAATTGAGAAQAASSASGAATAQPEPPAADAPAGVQGGAGTGAASGGDEGAGKEPGDGGPSAEEAARGLVIEKGERDFLQKLSPLIPSPRSAKRLVNVYRFIRASLSPGELARFRGSAGEAGEFHAVALLLAILTGFSSQAVPLFRALDETAEGSSGGWWEFCDALRPEGMDPEHWGKLTAALAAVRKELPMDDSLEPFVRWAPHVARFSFQTGQLFARRHG